MLHENIQAARKEAGLTQEELAGRIFVVRQTIAKWERGLSVPDADALIRLAEALEVPVSRLLGREEHQPSTEALGEELARVNAELAEMAARARQNERAGRVRGLMIFIAFLTLVVALKGESWVYLLAAGAGMLACLVILWRNLELLTRVVNPEAELKPLRIVTVFSAILLVGLIGLAALLETGALKMSEGAEEAFAVALIAGVMVFFGWIGPRLPFNRHVGLRLPWTVRDADAWNAAHRAMGWLGIPVAMGYVAAVMAFGQVEVPTTVALLIYIGIPAAISGWVFWKKWN